MAAISSEQWGDGMASADLEPITGVWGRASAGSKAEPLVKGSGDEAP